MKFDSKFLMNVFMIAALATPVANQMGWAEEKPYAERTPEEQAQDLKEFQAELLEERTQLSIDAHAQNAREEREKETQEAAAAKTKTAAKAKNKPKKQRFVSGVKVDAVVGYRTDTGTVSGYGGVFGGKAKVTSEKNILSMRSNELDGELLIGGVGKNTMVGSAKARAMVSRDKDAKHSYGFELSQDSNPIGHRTLVKLLYGRKVLDGNLVFNLHTGRDGDRTNDTSSVTMGVGAEASQNVLDLFDISALAEYSANFGQGRDMITETEILTPTEQITRVTRSGMRQDGWNGVTTLGAAISRTLADGGTISAHAKVQDRQSKLVEYGFETIAQHEDDSKSLEFGITAAIPIK